MTKQDLLEKLKGGVPEWNRWRDENPLIRIDLSGMDLSNLNLDKINLDHADLYGAKLKNTKLRDSRLHNANLGISEAAGADFSYAEASRAIFRDSKDYSGTNFFRAILHEADMTNCNLTGANFDEATLVQADLRWAKLTDATFVYAAMKSCNLAGAKCHKTDFSRAELDPSTFKDTVLEEANFTSAQFGNTDLLNLEFKNCIGLETIVHKKHSPIDDGSLAMNLDLPMAFLEGIGLEPWRIESLGLHKKDISHKEAAIISEKIEQARTINQDAICDLFISYSRKDALFLEELKPILKSRNVSWWQDTSHAAAGRLKEIILAAITSRSILFVLSEGSLASNWCKWEIIEAKKQGKTLFVISLDNAWEKSKWPLELLKYVKEHNILDFSHKINTPEFSIEFEKLMKGLKKDRGK